MHCIQQLLQYGYKVPMIDCTYVLHIASPCEVITDEAIIEIAVYGTLNVLRGASQQRCVRKIVLTIGYNNHNKLFTENDWTNLNWKHLHPYHKSKTLAEKTAWNFMEKNPDVSFSLTVLNPSLIVGPSLQNAKGSSIMIISRFMDGSMPAYPLMKLGLIDVRDAARAHILAMKETKCNGQRILITAETLSFQQIANILREEFADKGYRIPRFKAPYIALWFYSLIDKVALQALSLYGHEDNFDNSKASQLLGMSYQNVRKSLLEMAYDMIERNVLPTMKNANPHDYTNVIPEDSFCLELEDFFSQNLLRCNKSIINWKGAENRAPLSVLTPQPKHDGRAHPNTDLEKIY
uniref:3Beta_HSD domain-containing protein n=1 Tax=Wuchereria bancrofti TaxID=6293 RepID=A0A1I8EF80_WUCBA